MRVIADELLERVASHAPLDPETTRAVVRAVISEIGRCLSRPARELLDEELDPVLARWIGIDTGRSLEARLTTLGLDGGRAAEAIASVGRALADQLSDEMVGWLERELPTELASVLVLSSTGTERRGRRHDRHLAEAQPSEHGLATAHATRAQHESIAAANPHADSKLSSSPGMTQERDRETLAEGHDPRT